MPIDTRGRARGYDAVIVGAGLGGSTLAYRLAQRGARVLVVEQGDFLPLPMRKAGDPVGRYIHDFPSGLNVGGFSKFYGAALYRMREHDFRQTRHEGGDSPVWPITYADLEPYYCEVERLYRVHGSPAGDASEPPRSTAYPYPPLPHAPHVAALIDRLTQSGSRVAAIPRALDYGDGGRCVLCPTCDAYYCQLDAKMDAEIAALRPALDSGYVELITGTRCLRVVTSADGAKATGVVIQRAGKEETIEAAFVAVCAGVGPTAQLLLASRSARHPRGLGNATDCVGRYYGGHSTGLIFPLISFTAKLPGMHSKTFAITTYCNGSPDWPYPLGMIQAAGQIPFWDTEHLSWWKKSAARLVGERSIYCFYMTEALPTRESGLKFRGDGSYTIEPPVHNGKTFARMRALAIETFKRAGYRVIAPKARLLWHQVGTARFGTDPESSVLDPTCKVHDVDRLYVVDASVLPSAGVVNTGLTIAALALRVGDTIAGVQAGTATPPSGMRSPAS
jgi:choline dehydrogenase-like flavoprotein